MSHFALLTECFFNEIHFSTKILGGVLKKLIKYLDYPL